MSSAGFAHHGGRLGAARAAYSQAPQPWIDLSTGINPRSYPAPRARGIALNRLPDTEELAKLEAVAAAAFGVDDPRRVLATGGTEPALRLLPYVLRQKSAWVAGPTYGSHADAWQSAGIPTNVIPDSRLEESVAEQTAGPQTAAERTAIVVVNPNNPDGRVIGRERLLGLHGLVAAREGVLVVDEAFGEVAPEWSVARFAGVPGGAGVSGEPGAPGAERMLVLRSFGKFYGLAGVRLGFVVGAPVLLQRLRAAIGDWPVSVDALVAGLAAYADHGWAERTRIHLARAARRLDEMLLQHGFEIVGGTSLYRLVRAADAPARFERLAAAGILTRPFQYDSTLLRFGLPGSPEAWRRLRQALGGM